jgi:site-specific DNA recombinase
MRAALYIRVSTDEQAKEGFSLIAQKALLERKAAEWGDTIIKHYIDDGYSASTMKRPALQQIISDAEKKMFDVVIYWRLDRLSRRSRDFHNLIDILDRYDIGIKSATEQIDTTTAIGRFQRELSVSLAQLERETISERVQFVMEERARKGLRNGSTAPFGFDYKEDKSFIINEEQAKIVRRIFNDYINGLGMKTIAHLYNREGVVSPSKKALWSAPGVKYILENVVYIGHLRWNNIDKSNKKTNKEIISVDQHEPIIDRITFERVQVEIKRRKKGGKKFTNDFLFSAVLRCGHCGATMQGLGYMKPSGRYRLYRCGKKVEHGGCDFHSISENAVIRAFLEALDLSDKEFEKYFDEPVGIDEERGKIESLQKELETISRRKKKWQLAYANDLMTLDELREHTEEDRIREEEINKQLESVPQKTKTYLSKEEITNALQHLRENWHKIQNVKAKKLFIQEAFEYLTINTHPDSKVGQGFRIRVVVTDLKMRM